MEIVRGLEALPLSDEPAVVTVGFFDGVHLGHQQVFATTVKRARERDIRSVAVTFDRHPREVLTPGQEPRLLTTVERKASLIEAMGVDVLVVLPFTATFSRVPAEDFVGDVLVGGIHAVHAAMGANFTFGFKAAGTVETLPAMGEPYGLTAEGVSLFELDGRTVSSSSVRHALSAGDLAWPLAALGRRFVLDGEVTSGHGRGKGLGYPTANLRTWPRLLLPGQGIYAGVAEVYLARWERELLAHGPRARSTLSARRAARRAVFDLLMLALSVPIGWPCYQRIRGEAQRLDGKQRAAARAFQRALLSARQLGMPYDEALAHLDLARIAPAHSSTRAEHAARAEQMLKQLACPLDLERARQLLDARD